MQPEREMQSEHGHLKRTVEHRIHERTSRRVQNLRVEAIDGQIVVRGTARSFFVKLLALEAAREVLALTCSAPLLVDIEVI
jgi:hypothetical protein